jgi:glycosyltransferase involved in cell wall biosynthesis
LKVSVIIPVKNRARLLAITLHNVLNQSLPPYEVIVVDDGSEDNIGEVIQRYSSQVIFTKNKGRGPGAARNEGIRMATGNAIQFFDSDDLMTQNKLEVQSSLLQSNAAGFAYGPYVKALQKPGGDWQQMDVIMQYYPLPEGRLPEFVLEGWCPITQSALFKKELVDEVGFWKEDLMPHEDYEYWYRISQSASYFAHENKSCVIYRQHENQITDKAITNKDRWLDGINAMNYIRSAMKTKESLKSRLLFKGRLANSKMGYASNFGTGTHYLSTNFSEKMLAYCYRISSRLERGKTGTAWSRLQGALKDSDQFNSYIGKVIIDNQL